MRNLSYGTGYGPSYRERAPVTVHKKGGRGFSKLKKAGLILAAIIALLLFTIWIFLGQFRFMMFRSMGFTGFPFGNRTYLVLFQNNYELRPTGGFISTYGELKFSHGLYQGIEFHDVYGDINNHPQVEPPLIIKTLLAGPEYTTGHNFRDSNFDPDFTVAKDDVINFYNMVYPDTKIDGVIAADFTFLENLVEMYEPLKVEEYELTKENLFETLTTIVSDIDRHNEETIANRKNISGEITKKILTKSLILPWRAKALLNEAASAFDEKHLLAAFTRKGIANSYKIRGWDGALPDSDLGDFLAVNDANYGGMKSNRYITRDITYQIDISGEKDLLGNPVAKAKVTITLNHNGIWNVPLSGIYTSYLRTIIPLGSDISLAGAISEPRESAEVIGDTVSIEPGQSATYTYEYELPEYVWNNGTYFLHLHKQPGTLGDHYRVVVKAPQGSGIESDQFDIRENIALFETYLLNDENLSFTLLEDQNAPRIVSHEITDLNEVTVIFNEPISAASISGVNFGIIDLNYSSEETDEIVVANVRVEGSVVVLSLSGMTDQPGERYELVLKDIQDLKGNLISPNPRTVTVIQDKEGESLIEGTTVEAGTGSVTE